MSWTHVGSQTSGTSGSVASRSITYPVGTAEGDLAVVVATVNDSATANAVIEGSPSLWNVAGAEPENGANNSFMSSVCYWKVLTQADIDLGSVTVNFNGFRSYGLSITVWRADAGSVGFDDVAVVTKDISDGNSTPSTIPGLTLANPDSLVVVAFSASQSTSTYAFTQTLRTSGVFGTRNTAIAADVVASSGVTGPLDASIQNDFYGRVVFAMAFYEISLDPPEVSPAKTESYELMDWDSMEETASSVGLSTDTGHTNETWETR